MPSLLLRGPTSASTTQDPRQLVVGRGQEATLQCFPMNSHIYVYWYQQFPGEGLKFMISLGKEETLDESEMPTKRFSAVFPQEGPSVFKIQLAEPGDSAVYFCASSLSTAMQSHILSMHKRPPGPASETDEGWGRAHGLISERISSEAFCRVKVEIDIA